VKPDQVTDPGTVTRLLADLDSGNPSALEALVAIVYDELRQLAHLHRRSWNGDATMGTTALVHEAYLKLVDSDRINARTRVHFLRVASKAMRQILCNYGRDRRALKRGGDSPMVPIDVLGDRAPELAFNDEQKDTLKYLDDALVRLEAADPRLSAVVECRFFGGLTIEETAHVLSISPATVKREWTMAKAWLFRRMKTEG